MASSNLLQLTQTRNLNDPAAIRLSHDSASDHPGPMIPAAAARARRGRPGRAGPGPGPRRRAGRSLLVLGGGPSPPPGLSPTVRRAQLNRTWARAASRRRAGRATPAAAALAASAGGPAGALRQAAGFCIRPPVTRAGSHGDGPCGPEGRLTAASSAAAPGPGEPEVPGPAAGADSESQHASHPGRAAAVTRNRCWARADRALAGRAANLKAP